MLRLIAVTLVVCIPLTAVAQNAQPVFTLKSVGPNVWAAIDAFGGGSNAGFIVGDDGVAVVDTLSYVDAARQFLAAIRMQTPRSIRYVVDTHYHVDHVAGNGVFKDTGAIVMAQRKVRCWIHSENEHLYGADLTPAFKVMVDALVPPTNIYDNSVDWNLGSRNVQLRNMPGHTGADTVVIVPDAHVVFAGDLVWRNIAPNLIDASIAPWIATLNTLLSTYPDYTFIPGHGDVATAADVAAFRDYLVALRDRVANGQKQGLSGDALVGSVLPALTSTYSTWDLAGARDNILQTDADLRGTKRVPKTLPNRAACATPY
jgi:glyoxylase-like metal-dependent hydrolase (beta-lactamase superfamily II)